MSILKPIDAAVVGNAHPVELPVDLGILLKLIAELRDDRSVREDEQFGVLLNHVSLCFLRTHLVPTILSIRFQVSSASLVRVVIVMNATTV